MVQERSFRRSSLRWSSAEIDRLVRAVKLEDVNPPVERFTGIAAALERNPSSVRGMWLEVRDAGLRGRQAASPAVVAYVRRRFPRVEADEIDDSSLDALVAAFRETQRKGNALLERIFALAAGNAESLAAMRLTLFGTVAPVEVSAPSTVADIGADGEFVEACKPEFEAVHQSAA